MSDETQTEKRKKLESQKKRQEMQANFCQKNLEKILNKDDKTKLLLEKLEKFDCELPPGMIKCDPCIDINDINGGYKPSYIDEKTGEKIEKSIILCESKLNQKSMKKVLKHELIHAFDDCTTNLDWTNCLHHACSEIRASKLSGECTLGQEISRGHFGLIGYVKNCVKRRAILSVQTNPNCSKKAEEFVEKVWDACYHNKLPYEEE
eukprot:gene7308-11627_t